MRIQRTLPALAVGTALLFVVGCDDPQTAIYKVFSKQGLTLLTPARDYIKIGGIVLLPKGNNQLQYEDPYDSIAPADGTSTNFNAVLQQQTDKSTTAASLTVALAQLANLPIGFSFQDGPQSVSLDQINSSGKRYTTQMMSSLLKKSDTASEINSRLAEGDRAFVIQEVYTAKSMKVSATNNMSLAANVGGSPVTKSCDDSQQGGTKSGNNTPNNSQQTGAKTGGPHASGPRQGGTQGGGQQGGTQKGVSVNVCRNSQATLSFTSDTEIPFAVRLNEIEAGPGGILRVKEKNFKLPSKALGSDKDVSASVLIDPNQPTAVLPEASIKHR